MVKTGSKKTSRYSRTKKSGMTTVAVRKQWLASAMRKQFLSLYDDVKKLMKQGCIRKSTLKRAEDLNKLVNDNETLLRTEDEFRYLKSRCMTTEIFDQFGLTEQAEAVCKEGAEVLKQIPFASDLLLPITENKEIVREKIRLCVDYTQIYYYRTHKYDAAKEIILRCRNFVERRLQDKDFPCYGTLGQIYYLLGKIYRQQNDYSAAEECFSRAIENYYYRAELRTINFQEDLALATLKSGICLALGIGWINYVRGHLRKALNNNILPARVLLLHANDELSAAYLDIIYSSIQRALSKKGDVGLEKAVEFAERSYSVFRDNGHRRYMARAAWELGLAYFYSGQLEKAEKKVEEVKAISKEANDYRWLCNSLVLSSRIERERGKTLPAPQRHEKLLEAETLASQALELADRYNQKLCKIDSLITRSEAMIELGKTTVAREGLHDALALNREFRADNTTTANPKTNALCYLYIARSFTQEREGRQAREYFEKWRELEKEVEHEYIRELAEDVKQELQALNEDLVIEAGPALELDYKKHLKTLKQFLIDQAKQRAHEKQKIADMLGVSRQTLFEWEHELKL